ncbi:hypothetical protein BIW11_10375 [Tropilaelaps mercedesae]|uniref:Pectinesterase inhibitor domain-containing protein n=1 Tax=Tropilaelaps mercedesae TaxID=418985 RepID=A0A1V9XGE5_9ACAR|nr:hypothetical protein BIW11_10375 [Tropilaelaps mercedesae]
MDSHGSLLFLRTLLAFAIVIQAATTAILAAAEEPTTTTTGSVSPVASEITTSTAPSTESTLSQCAKMYVYDCCEEFKNVSLDNMDMILKRVIDYQNSSPNKTSVWALNKTESLQMKDCPQPYYVANAKLSKMPVGENSTTIVDCQIRFLYSSLEQDSASVSSADTALIEIKEFCNGAAEWRAGLLITILLSLLTLLNPGQH